MIQEHQKLMRDKETSYQVKLMEENEKYQTLVYEKTSKKKKTEEYQVK